MTSLRYHPLAVEEIVAAYEFLYENADRETAEDCRRRVLEKILHCHRYPLHYTIRRHNVRRANLERFKEHYLAFMLWSELFVVIALGHAKRRPFYWYRRPKEFRLNQFRSDRP